MHCRTNYFESLEKESRAQHSVWEFDPVIAVYSVSFECVLRFMLLLFRQLWLPYWEIKYKKCRKQQPT